MVLSFLANRLLLQDPNVEDSYPERPGQPDCPVSNSFSSFIICLIKILTILFFTLQYFVKSNNCRFKSKCKFNHPKEKLSALEAGSDNEVS